MQLFIAFFGLGLFGVDVPGLACRRRGADLLDRSLPDGNLARCVEAVAEGPVGAAKSLALTYGQQMR